MVCIVFWNESLASKNRLLKNVQHTVSSLINLHCTTHGSDCFQTINGENRGKSGENANI